MAPLLQVDDDYLQLHLGTRQSESFIQSSFEGMNIK